MAALKMSRADADVILEERYAQGRELMERATEEAVKDAVHAESWRMDWHRWRDVTREALAHVYVGEEIRSEFEDSAWSGTGSSRDWLERLSHEVRLLRESVNKLASFRERLRFADEPRPRLEPAEAIEATTAQAAAPAESGPPVVFLVHGHDIGTRETVARFLEREGPDDVDVVILEEQANKGRTVLEKLEDHAASAKYAIVLLTADDVGRAKDSEELKPRARQNVVFEFGWFCGLIKRKNVAVLHDPKVELPSDLAGLVYIPLTGDWQRKLTDELKSSGLDY
jgi:predicted nucleotide-binding protein